MKIRVPTDIAMMFFMFVLTWIARNSAFDLPRIFQSFLADLICVPLTLYIAMQFTSYLKNDPQFLFSISHLVFAWVWISVLCEVIIPVLSNRYVADIWDVLMYASGTIYVWRFQKNWPRHSRIQSIAP